MQDNPRSVSRYTSDADQYRELGAKLLAMMQTTLSGTLYVYQGEEIGMKNMPPSWSTVSTESRLGAGGELTLRRTNTKT